MTSDSGGISPEKPLRKEALFVYKKLPPVRVLVGLFLILLSYVIGWPAVALLAGIAVYTRKPLILAVGGPLVYGFSHAVFLVGIYYAGKDVAKTYLKQFLKALKERKWMN